MEEAFKDMVKEMDIIYIILQVLNIIVVGLVGFVVGREKISLYRGIKELAGYIYFNVGNPQKNGF